MNINRDYLIINDVKKSNIKLDNGSMFFYITDKNTQNIFVNLVINVSNNDLIQKYANIENAEDYTLTMNIVKPDNTYKVVEGKLHDKEKAIFEFDLNEDCCDEIGTYRCELLTKCNINDHEEITTSNKITYKVKSSVLNDLDDIVEAPEYPLVIQLFDKLSDIEQYEEDRRANELARQLAEEQRQARFNVLDADMSDRIEIIDDKLVEIDNVLISKEDIADIKAKNTEQDRRLDIAENRLDNINTNIENVLQPTVQRVDTIEAINTTQNNRLDAIEAKNTQQDNRLDVAENRLANIGNDITNTMAPIINEHTSRLNDIEVIDVAQNTRLDAIEAKNQQQDDRLLDIEKANKKQDMDIKCLFNFHTVDITEEGNNIYLPNSAEGYCEIDNIQGNTLVNCNKEPDKELILNGNINTSGDNTITITEGVDGGLVDVALEGNTLVNVSKTKDSTAITKAYTVENSGNHIALQGDIDGSCRPVITGNTLVNLNTDTIYEAQDVRYDYLLTYAPENNTVYTIIIDISYKIIGEGIACWCGFLNSMRTNWAVPSVNIANGLNVISVTLQGNDIGEYFRVGWDKGIASNIVINKLLILEGDYTNKPIPDYFEGLQSSFEDNLVPENILSERITDTTTKVEYSLTKSIKPNTTYTIYLRGDQMVYCGFQKDSTWVKYKAPIQGVQTITTDDNTGINKFSVHSSGNIRVDTCLLFEGDYTNFDFSNYNPTKVGKYKVDYKSTREDGTVGNTKTLYLNSPLLEGDTIEEKNGGIYYVHRSKKIPIRNLVTGNFSANLLSNSYGITWLNILNNDFKHKINTECKCDNIKIGVIDSLSRDDETRITSNLGNANQWRILNKELTTVDEYINWINSLDSTIVYELASPTYELIEQSNLAIDSYANGHLDFNTAVPVEKVEFKPFSEELTYLYANTQYTIQFVSDKAITADITLGGTQLLAQSIVAGLNRISITTPSELVDNKLVISGVGANISEVVVTDTNREFGYFEGMKSVGECEELEITSSNSDNSLSNKKTLTHEPLRGTRDAKDRYVLIDGKWYIERKCGIRAYQEGDEDNYKTDLVNTVYPLETPTYEEIDYNPLEVYSGTTNITTNSVIPTNITVKNHGYNCLLKPSTTYTVSSNLGLNTVTTPSTLTEDCLRFMDTDTSDVTTMRDVLVLEGDWTSKADLIPANFSGIESAFEQEYDAEKGKYKVNVKVANEDKTEENNITFYINEPLRGVGDVKDRVYVKDDKVVVQRNCAEFIINETNPYSISGNNLSYPSVLRIWLSQAYIPNVKRGKVLCDTLSNYDAMTKDIPGIACINGFDIHLPLPTTSTIDEVREYLRDNPLKVIYQSAEPTYEEVEYNDTKLFIESFKNSTLSYNSNVPVTSKLYYSYSVPIVDTVAQTANVTDQQDSMIIDLATQVAVMEMMLM